MPEGGCIKTGYCNKYHRLSDGIPVNHKCRILGTEYLAAEKAQNYEAMIEYFEQVRPIVLHDGEQDDAVPKEDEPPSFGIRIG